MKTMAMVVVTAVLAGCASQAERAAPYAVSLENGPAGTLKQTMLMHEDALYALTQIQEMDEQSYRFCERAFDYERQPVHVDWMTVLSAEGEILRERIVTCKMKQGTAEWLMREMYRPRVPNLLVEQMRD